MATQSFSEKVNQITEKLGGVADSVTTDGSKSNLYLIAGIVAVPAIFFAVFYFIFKPKEGEDRNYKKILMMTLVASLLAIPLLYLASINGYLPF